MEATSREQQREARRQKVLARSQGGHRAPVVDLATEQKEIAPQGTTAVLDDDDDADQAAVDGLLDPAVAAAAAGEDSGKSASRLAAERRRQRILSKSTERMAKVQGDRVIGGGVEEEVAAGEGGGEESLDDMLEAAEAEFFGGGHGGTGTGAGVAEAKPAAPHQAYFKSAKSGSGESNLDGGGAGSGAGGAAAQSKPARQRVGSARGGFKAPRSEDGTPKRSPTAGRAGTSSRRPTGNKALEKKRFDLAAIQSLSGAAGTGAETAADPGRKRLLGGVRFWTGLEAVTKTALLLVVGAGVGGLMLPEARAAVAQAKFEAEHMQTLADSRSRLELFLEEHTRSGGPEGPTTLEIDLDDVRGEFGDIVSDPSSDSYEADSRADSATENRGEIGREAAGGGQEKEALKWEEFEDVAYGADDGAISRGTKYFLSLMDFVVGWAHYLSTVSMPWGSGSEISCISAIYLALLVRFVVAAVFSGVRLALALPMFPPTAPTSKPGMIMGMVLASVPTLGKILAWGNMVKSIFSDTNLVVAGTVLTLAVSLAAEEGAGPRRLVGSISGAFGLLNSQAPDDPTLKEL